MADRDRHKVIIDDREFNTRLASDMDIGTYGIIIDDGKPGSCVNAGRIIGRHWSSNCNKKRTAELFALDNPGSTWSNPSFTVRVLQPGEEITLRIGE